MFKKYFLLISAVLFILCITRNFYADDHGTARNMGLGKAGFVSSSGIDAYGLNPANFDYRSPVELKLLGKGKKKSAPRWEVALINGGGSYGSDTSIGFYNKYLSTLTINRESFTKIFTDIASVLDFRQNVLPSSTTDVNYDFELKWFSINYAHPKLGGINFSIADRVGLNTIVMKRDDAMPATFSINIFPNGTYDITNVELNQSEAIAWWLRKYSLGYSKQFNLNKDKGIRSISFGISASMVHGFGNVITYFSSLDASTYGVRKDPDGRTHVDEISGRQNFHSASALTDFFKDYRDGSRDHYEPFPKPAGMGYSFDFGFASQINDKFRFYTGLTDYGKVKWDYNVVTNHDTNSFNYQNFYLDKTDPTYNALVNDLDGFATRDTVTPYSTDMPTKIHTGIMYQANEKLLLELVWTVGFNELPGNSKRGVFSLGTEYYAMKFLPLRLGVSVGGPEGYTIACGAGLKLKNITFDVGSNNINGLILNQRLSIALSGKVIF